ncbi:DUF3078 domain-containing protein [Pontibacter sp. HSC-14F20]|uniref:DUF3078 domain-containing protein n=1 Tax=Pontibacter sp. HSC-14F20 TaxID=2864136 RepID=UPI001C72EF67|nr:DUF3078 domain-containing protein [Pontibacter sp. HSC-14F20]MBX0334179.1 DUF3078 domain-containing protein [Pontibacter sp. HSC-14F20]
MFKASLRIFTLFFLLTHFTLSAASAQDTPADTAAVQNIWNFGGAGTVNFSQVSLSNWAAGGQSSFSVLGILNLYGNYKKGKNTWNNTLDLTYGTVKLQDQRLRKSDDRLELNLKYGRQASSKWFYTVQLNTRTQISPTYTPERDSVVSNFMAPAFMLASIGMDYKPNPKLSIFISPFTGKFTAVLNQRMADYGAFGVEPAQRDLEGNLIPGTGERFREEFGGFVNVRFKDEIFKNVTLQSKADLFSNYLRNAKNIDVSWENLVNFKVNKFLSASLFLHMIYDDDILIDIDRSGDGTMDGKGPRLQLKETMGIGLSYKFE